MADQRYSNYLRSYSDSDSDDLSIDEDLLERMKPPPYNFSESLEIIHPAKTTYASVVTKSQFAATTGSTAMQKKTIYHQIASTCNQIGFDSKGNIPPAVQKKTVLKPTANEQETKSAQTRSDYISKTVQWKNAEQQTNFEQNHKNNQTVCDSENKLSTVITKTVQQQTDKQERKCIDVIRKNTMTNNFPVGLTKNAKQHTNNTQNHKEVQTTSIDKEIPTNTLGAQINKLESKYKKVLKNNENSDTTPYLDNKIKTEVIELKLKLHTFSYKQWEKLGIILQKIHNAQSNVRKNTEFETKLNLPQKQKKSSIKVQSMKHETQSSLQKTDEQNLDKTKKKLTGSHIQNTTISAPLQKINKELSNKTKEEVKNCTRYTSLNTNILFVNKVSEVPAGAQIVAPLQKVDKDIPNKTTTSTSFQNVSKQSMNKTWEDFESITISTPLEEERKGISDYLKREEPYLQSLLRLHQVDLAKMSSDITTSKPANTRFNNTFETFNKEIGPETGVELGNKNIQTFSSAQPLNACSLL